MLVLNFDTMDDEQLIALYNDNHNKICNLMLLDDNVLEECALIELEMCRRGIDVKTEEGRSNTDSK